MKQRLFSLSLLFLIGFSFCGCATMTPSLYIPPSDAVERSFPAPPPAVIRLPVSVSVSIPKLVALPSNLTHWLDGKIREIEKNAEKPEGLMKLATPLSGLPKLWDAMQEPIYIDKNVWLLIRPETLSTGVAFPDKVNPFTWKVVLEMMSHPILIFGEKPLVDKKLLPPLNVYKSGPTGFHAISNTGISFTEANRILADPKSGLVNYRIRGTGSYRLKIKGVRLYGSGGQVIAQTRIEYYPLINFEGKPSRMTIYFRGTPEYDPKRQMFYLKHLDYDVRTGDLLVQVASWIFKSDILDTLRKKAHIPIGSKLEQLRERMNVVLNRPVGEHSRLATQVNSFRMLGAFVDRDGIQAQMSLDGTAQLDLLSR